MYLPKRTGFQHDKAHGDFNDLARRTASDKIWRDKAFNIAKIKEVLLQWFMNSLIKKLPVVVLKMKIFLIKN